MISSGAPCAPRFRPGGQLVGGEFLPGIRRLAFRKRGVKACEGPCEAVAFNLFMTREAITSMLLAGGVGFLLVPSAFAQFHKKTANGATQVNPQAVESVQRQSAGALAVPGAPNVGATGATGIAGGGLSGGDTILPEEVKRALAKNNVRLGQMQGKQIDIWGRAIHHSDGSFTESRKQVETNTIEQITKSKSGVTLQRRMVMLDERGNPVEVLIYDGRNQFKYRGLQVYDRLGRFAEEQIYDAEGTLIRRKVQEYDPRGGQLPLRSWDYVANVPADLRLVISQDDSAAPGSLQASPRMASSPGAQPASPAEENATRAPRRGLPRIFAPRN